MTPRRRGHIRLAESAPVEETMRALQGFVHGDAAQPPMRFTLVVATVDRVSEVAAFLEALTIQTYKHFDVFVVDQNDDDRLTPLLERYSNTLSIEHLRSARGLSRARNVALRF